MMSTQSSSTTHSLYRHLALLLLFPSLILCLSDSALQNRNQYISDSSLFIRSVPNPNDPVKFDDMPSCGREDCLPFKPESIGCPDGDLSRDCFCGSAKALNCALWGCPSTEYTLVQKWQSLTCTGIGFGELSAIPSCAQECLLPTSIRESCSMKSFDCFCGADLPAACLATCSSADTATVRAWKSEQCAKAQPDAEAVTGPRTTTIPAKISVYTTAGNVVTSTVAPAVTTVVTNANTNANTINVNTGDARGIFSGLAVTRIILGTAGLHLVAVMVRRFV